MDPTAPLLLRHDQDGIVRLVLNRPAARNALSLALMEALLAELEGIGADPLARVVIVAASGPAFSAGHDLKELRAHDDREFHERLFTSCSRLMQAIVHLPQPVIAEVQGIATAAGCQLVASCDLAIAAASARFATPGVDIGLFCSTPMVALSRNVAPKEAMAMLLTGAPIDAPEAQRIGLVNRVVADAELPAATMALARTLATKSRHVLKIGKEAFYRQLELPLAEAYAYAGRVMALNMQALDAREGIDAFIEKRRPLWCDR